MRASIRYVLIAYAMLAVVIVGRPAPARDGASAPIVLGGDQAEPRAPSACDRTYGDDALGEWIARTIRSLCAHNDPKGSLSVFLFTAPSLGAHGQPDLAALDQAYAAGQSNPLVLWAVTLNSKCNMPFQASECQRMLTAARLLSRAAPDNALAWLALGYAADKALASPEEVRSALEHAADAPDVHDYAIDLSRLAVDAASEIEIPAAVLGNQTPSQFRSQFANPFVAPSSVVIGWLHQGCNATHGNPPPAAEACSAANNRMHAF